MLACGLVGGQRILGQPEKRIIHGGWLGSSAANQVSSAFALQVGEVRMIGAAAVAFGDFDFSAHAKKGADHTINKLYLSQEWRGQSDLMVIHPVHAYRAPLPSMP